MSCCSGQNQTKHFDLTLLWRAEPHVERRLLFSADGVDGKWVGNGSANYDLGDPIYPCGHSPLRGDIIVRVKARLECTETPDKTYIGGVLQFTVGKSTFRGKLKPTELVCESGGPTSTAEWLMVWLGPLGSAILRAKGSVLPPE